MSALSPPQTSNVFPMSEKRLPAPLVPAGCDLRGMPGMFLDTLRLTRSGLTAHATGDEFRAAVLLWCEAWSQLPASSLPDDDVELAALAHVTRTRWKRLRAGALRGWIKCADGRLYHPVVAEKAREAWESRVKQRAKANKRWANSRQEFEENPEVSGKNSEKLEEKFLDSGSEPAQFNDLADAAAMPVKRTEGKDKSTISPDGDMAPASGADESPTEAIRRQLWREGLAILNRVVPGACSKSLRTMVGHMAGKLGGGAEGGARAVQLLRDAEAAIAGSRVPDFAVAGTPDERVKALQDFLYRQTGARRVGKSAPLKPQAPRGAGSVLNKIMGEEGLL